jgi:chemotaxis protein CheX
VNSAIGEGISSVEKMEKGRTALVHALEDIFSSMYGETVEIVSDAQISDAPRISSMIGFGGESSGFVALHFSGEMACRITEDLLGMQVQEVDETVRDTVAEMANMVGGGLRNQMSSTHDNFKLSLPSVVQGLEYSTKGPAGSQEVLFAAVAGPYRFKVQLVLEKKSL